MSNSATANRGEEASSATRTSHERLDNYDTAMPAHLRRELGLRTWAWTPLAPLWIVLDRMQGRTSASDQKLYTELCARAAQDPATFASFKAHPDYTEVLEHVTCSQGQEYLRIALQQTPALEAHLSRFRKNDTVGSPGTCDYGGHGTFSPTTLRYIKVLSDLITMFGPLDGLNIIEIGGGYGGQCFITASMFRLASYTIVDLAPCLRLQGTYLTQLDVQNVHFVQGDQLPAAESYDLAISNYAFSECTRKIQETYLTHVLARAARGYLTCNWFSPRHFRSFGPSDLLEAIPMSRLLPEEPLTAPENRIWIWGDATA